MKNPKTVLVLRTCNADMTSYNGFTWPERGPVTCPDWKTTPSCGNGLHGFLWGEGDGGLANWAEDAKWLVVKVNATDIINLNGKVKYPSGTVVYCGDRATATDYLQNHGGQGRQIVGGTATAGYGGTATAGYGGTATAGDSGTIIIKRWNGKRWKYVLGSIGEDGLLPNTPYTLDENGQFIAILPLSTKA